MKHVLITGGSRGIGAAAVRAFCAAGYQVTFIYHNNQESAEKLCAETGASAVCCDVSDTQAVNAAIGKLSPVDTLICSAGIAHYGLISDISEEEWEHLFSVNVGGVYRCVKAVLPAMLQKQSGCILTLSSMWGQVGASCEVAYSASKGAVIAMTKALAKELGPSGIRVNCVCPGVILTDMSICVGEETLASLAGDTPLGRNGTPEDVASALLYLAQADFITGQILPVNGGFVI